MTRRLPIASPRWRWLWVGLAVIWLAELAVFSLSARRGSIHMERWQMGVALLVPLLGTLAFLGDLRQSTRRTGFWAWAFWPVACLLAGVWIGVYMKILGWW